MGARPPHLTPRRWFRKRRRNEAREQLAGYLRSFGAAGLERMSEEESHAAAAMVLSQYGHQHHLKDAINQVMGVTRHKVATKFELAVREAKKHLDKYMLEVEQHIIELQDVDSAAGVLSAKAWALCISIAVTVFTTMLL